MGDIAVDDSAPTTTPATGATTVATARLEQDHLAVQVAAAASKPVGPPATPAVMSGESMDIATCDQTDRLLADDDSSQDTVPENEDTEMMEADDAVEKPSGKHADIVSASSSAASSPPVNQLEPPTNEEKRDEKETKEKKEAMNDEPEEHAALEDERRWFGGLPAFVKAAYGLPDADTSAAAHGFPMCTNCHDNQNKPALASVSCQEAQCAFKDAVVCSACFRDQHASETDRMHRQRITKACPHCHLQRVKVWCVLCDVSMCSDCHLAIHSGVKRVQNHKSFSLEGTPGLMLLQSKWTPHFRHAVVQLQRNHKQDAADHDQAKNHQTSTNATPSSAVPSLLTAPVATTLKRKRANEPPEIICIDDESSNSDPDTSARRPPQQQRQQQQNRQQSASRPSSPFANGSNNTGTVKQRAMVPVSEFQAVSAPNSHSANLSGTLSSSPATDAIPLPAHSFISPSPGGMSASMPAAVTPGQSTSWQTASISAPQMVAPAVPAAASAASTPTTENPIEVAMFDTLHKLSNGIALAEEHVAMLNNQVVQASYQSVQIAHNFMAQLQTQQQRLQQLLNKRDLTVVHLVAQSKAIIAKVKVLRLDLLGDIPQVQAASHRRCFQLSTQIKESEAVIATLNAQMDKTLETISTVSSEVFYRTVSAISGAIRSHQQAIANCKEERENEIVRLVQYHHGIRELLKRAVLQQQQARQQQNRQPHQQQQPQQQPGHQALHQALHQQRPQYQHLQPRPSELNGYTAFVQYAPHPMGMHQQHQQHQQSQQQPLAYESRSQAQSLVSSQNGNAIQLTTNPRCGTPPISPPPFS